MKASLLLAAHAVLASGAKDAPPVNPNHVFNAIHSNMRQWGSSVHHNGMSFFITTVPEDTELYHGRSTSDPVNGTEWLAFEPEHALGFARSRRGPPGGGRGPPGGGRGPPGGGPPGRDTDRDLSEKGASAKGKGDGDYHRGDSGSSAQVKGDADRHHGEHGASSKAKADGDHHHREFDGFAKLRGDVDRRHHRRTPDRGERTSEKHHRRSEQAPLTDPTTPQTAAAAADDDAGYLHTYRTKHDLRLLYIDGEAGAKSTKGTLDSQDIVLVPNPPEHVGEPGQNGGGPMGEKERAVGLCNLARDEWQGRVDGFLRMEAGFEIILCNFARDLSVVTINRADGSARHGSGPGFNQYWHAVASRYDDIGGGRAHSDTDDFVTALSFRDAVAFDDQGFPRATNDSAATAALRAAITARVLRHDSPARDWRSVADMVVARYADRIESLASGSHSTLADLQAEAEQTLVVFIDHAHRDTAAETRRCAAQLLPSGPGPRPLAYDVVLNVTTTICAALVDSAAADDLPSATAAFRRLKSWLNWAAFKRCAGCEYDEICFLPIWPAGSQEDYDHPSCRRDVGGGGGYWGGWH